MSGSSISIIIPTYNAGKEIKGLLLALEQQQTKPEEILIIDSSSTDNTLEIARQFQNVSIHRIKKEDFDHGKTRDNALRKSKGDIVVFLTQDCIPANEDFLSNLTAPLSDPMVAVSTGRQLPKKDATNMERLVRDFNYPENSQVKTLSDVPQMGIKAFFCSDACAAYRREIYLALGGFEYPIKTNEDMFFAAKAIQNGYKVVYAADALVYHSHNFTLKEQYQRNYIQGYEIERHKALLMNVPKESEGMKMVKYVSSELLKKGRIGSFIHFGLDCAARWLGSRAGRRKYLEESKR